MKYFKRTHRTHIFRNSIAFCRKNGQILFLLTLILIGAVLGVLIYSSLSVEQIGFFSALVSFSAVPMDFFSGCTAVVSSAFNVCLFLILLFLLGLTPYGCPLILCIPVFYGFCIGLAECIFYQNGGIIHVVRYAVLPVTISSVAVLIAGTQALRMSSLFSRQLLPSYAHCGGMWQDFKVYLLRFILSILIAFVSAFFQVILHMF